MTTEEIKALTHQVSAIVTEALLNQMVLEDHYIKTIGELTGKKEQDIKLELDELLPKHKLRAIEFINKITDKIIEENKGDAN